MKQEHQVGSLNGWIKELQQQAHAQRLELQDAHHGYIESRREQARLQARRIIYEGKKVLRETQIRNMHEMGEMNRAKELRVDTFSLQKLWESHESIQRLTSQLQEMQERMNSMNDSWEFQEVESNHSGKLSYVPSQPAMIPSSRSMLSRDKHFAIWYKEFIWTTGNVVGNQFSTFDSLPDQPQAIHHCATPRETESVPQAIGTGTSYASIGAQFQCAHLQEGRRLWVHFFRMIFRRILWLDSKDSKYQSCNSTSSLHLPHAYVGRKDSRPKWLLGLILHRRQCYGSKKWRWLIHWTN